MGGPAHSRDRGSGGGQSLDSSDHLIHRGAPARLAGKHGQEQLAKFLAGVGDQFLAKILAQAAIMRATATGQLHSSYRETPGWLDRAILRHLDEDDASTSWANLFMHFGFLQK